MPLKWAQQNYWNISSSVVTPVASETVGGYPLWQSSVIGTGGGGLQVWYERLIAWGRRWRQTVRFARRYRRGTPEQRRILERVTRALDSPSYPFAREAVHTTANTLGFRNKEAWVPYARLLKSQPGRAENVYRHLRACELTRESLRSSSRAEPASTLTNAETNLLVELAYTGFAVKGSYFDGVE
jgi:hypothetical protein